MDHYEVEKRGLAFASSQTAGRKPRGITRQGICLVDIFSCLFRIVMKRTGEVRACRSPVGGFHAIAFESSVSLATLSLQSGRYDVVASTPTAPPRIAYERLKRFKPQEIEALVKLDHPNIIKIFEVFQDEVNTYMVIQWCEASRWSL